MKRSFLRSPYLWAIAAVASVVGAAWIGRANYQPVITGSTAPPFTVFDMDGGEVRLSDFLGEEVLLVNVWATWCGPCLTEMPSMQRLFASTPPDRFKMLAILYKDEPAAADRLAIRQRYSFPILVDPGGQTAGLYGITGVPETYIVDKTGVLREKFIGPVQWDAPGARNMLSQSLAQ